MFDYAGFLINVCNKSDRHTLQIFQNDALCTCYNVTRRDKLSIAKMHNKSNLFSLEQRQTFQLLHLMYLHKNDANNLRIPVRRTRGAICAQFNVEKYNVCKYKNSPFIKGLISGNYYPVILHQAILSINSRRS